MKIKKRFLKCMAGIASLAIIATSFASCGEDSVYIGNYNDKDIASGIYIYNLLSAYYEAQNNMTENDTDVFAITIEDKNASDWMIAKAKENTKLYLAVEEKFDEYGLSLTDDEVTAAENTIDSMWEYYGSVYEGYGISQSSFLKCYENSLKSNKLFEYIYGENGEREVPEDDIKTYLKENYALINYISMNLVDGEGNLLKSAGKAERMEMAKDYVERAKNGEDFDSLNFEYLAYYDELVAEAEAAAAETETETSSDSNAGGNISFETVTEANANAMSVEETSEETVTETTSEETTVTEEETVSAETTAPEETSEETSSEETTAPESSESAETSYTTADIAALTGEDDSSSDESTYDSNKQVIKKDSASPDETVCNKVFDEMENGDITIVEEDEYYYVVYKMDILEDPEYYDSAKDSLLYEMREDDFTSLCEEWANNVSFDFNEKAIERYTPQKFAETTSE